METITDEQLNNIVKTTIFFQKRFPDKRISDEIRYGYFQEWVNRFASGHVESYCDSESLQVIKEIEVL